MGNEEFKARFSVYMEKIHQFPSNEYNTTVHSTLDSDFVTMTTLLFYGKAFKNFELLYRDKHII